MHKNKGSKDKEVEGNTNITGFCIKEDYHYTKWMEHQLEQGVRNVICLEFQLRVGGCESNKSYTWASSYEGEFLFALKD